MRQLNFKSPYTFDPATAGVDVDDSSITVPDQAMTVKEILNRCHAGMAPPGVIKRTEYDYDAGDPSGDDLDFTSPDNRIFDDLTEYADVREEHRLLRESIEAKKERNKVTHSSPSIREQTPESAPEGE